MFSPVITIGGGVVVDVSERRYRRTDDVAGRLETLMSQDMPARVACLVREQPFGMSLGDLIARTGLTAREAAAAAAKAPLTAIGEWYVESAWMQSARDRVVKTVREFHRKNPLLPGIPRQDLREGAPQFVLDALLAGAKEIVAEGEIVRARSHQVVLKEDEEQARAKIEAAFERAGLAVPAAREGIAG